MNDRDGTLGDRMCGDPGFWRADVSVRNLRRPGIGHDDFCPDRDPLFPRTGSEMSARLRSEYCEVGDRFAPEHPVS